MRLSAATETATPYSLVVHGQAADVLWLVIEGPLRGRLVWPKAIIRDRDGLSVPYRVGWIDIETPRIAETPDLIVARMDGSWMVRPVAIIEEPLVVTNVNRRRY